MVPMATKSRSAALPCVAISAQLICGISVWPRPHPAHHSRHMAGDTPCVGDLPAASPPVLCCQGLWDDSIHPCCRKRLCLPHCSQNWMLTCSRNEALSGRVLGCLPSLLHLWCAGESQAVPPSQGCVGRFLETGTRHPILHHPLGEQWRSKSGKCQICPRAGAR